MEKYTLGSYINKGSYGSVYQCFDEKHKEYAVKIINTDKKGIPCLVEASIMSSYLHPNIISAVKIISEPSRLCIIMERAETDLLNYIRNNTISPGLLKNISHQCCQAVAFLHKNGIIHCDIKPNNILYYSGDNVKIADFSLSTVKVSEECMFKDRICTPNYCSPEVLKREYWNESTDIWSLGCTLYEISTGSLLVPSQLDKNSSNNLVYSVMLSAIAIWRKRCNDNTVIDLDIKTQNVNQINPKIDNIDPEFIDLINSMLVYDHKERLSSRMVLKHSYFTGLQFASSSVLSPKNNITPNKKISDQIDSYFSRINVTNSSVISLTKELYFRCSNIENTPLKIDTCAWIAWKILTKKCPDQSEFFSQIFKIKELEREICKNLNYRLHLILPDQLTYYIKPYREFSKNFS